MHTQLIVEVFAARLYVCAALWHTNNNKTQIARLKQQQVIETKQKIFFRVIVGVWVSV